MSATVDTVLTYIRNNWDRSIYHDAPGQGFQGIDLPYPYSSPCIKEEGKFYFFFYWDTYFTNLGLMAHDRMEIAKANIQNMIWLIERQGYMPNHVGIYNRSQSPYLCRMVVDYFARVPADSEPDFFAQCAQALRQEYNFWNTARQTPVGLTQHGHHDTAEGCAAFYDRHLIERLGLPADASFPDKVYWGAQYMANAEATCDFTNRFDGRALDYCQVDLNALLYDYEVTLAEYSLRLGWGDHELWLARRTKRLARINQYMWSDAEGLFLDYDFTKDEHSKVAAQTGYQTLHCGLASAEQAARMVERMSLFERDHGMAYTPDVPGCRKFQWAFPNVWPPMAWIVMDGLRRYGFEADARRIAEKYVTTAVRLFEETGQLWEKTDAETGEVAGGEYDAAPMLGWSAGVFVDFVNYLG